MAVCLCYCASRWLTGLLGDGARGLPRVSQGLVEFRECCITLIDLTRDAVRPMQVDSVRDLLRAATGSRTQGEERTLDLFGRSVLNSRIAQLDRDRRTHNVSIALAIIDESAFQHGLGPIDHSRTLLDCCVQHCRGIGGLRISPLLFEDRRL